MIVLQTPRLVVRHLTLEDLDAVHAVFGDPEALHLWPRAYTREESEAWLKKKIEAYAREGYGLWALQLKSTGECIGDCGLQGRPEMEIAYHLQKKRWGSGYATEAAAACRDYAFQTLKIDRLVAYIMPNHDRSRRVAERIGMKIEGEIERPVGGRHLVYSLKADNIPWPRSFVPHNGTQIKRFRVPDSRAVRRPRFLAERDDKRR